MAADLDSRQRPRVAVTGIGIVTSLGAGREENWQALVAGQSGIRQITRFPVDHLATTISGMVDFLDSSRQGTVAHTTAMARMAAEEALQQSRIAPGALDGPLFLAAPPVEMDWQQRFELYRHAGKSSQPVYQRLLEAARLGHGRELFEEVLFGSIASRLVEFLGVRGLPVTLSTACASGATAIQLGCEAIRRGECDRAIAIGADGSGSAEALIRFSLLSALSTQNDPPEKASRPFSRDRDGFVLAEGAAALVLESLSSARARGAEVLGFVAGCGEKADDFHRTRSKPDGSPAIGAVRAALEDADLEPAEIDYINAHGTSTPENDKMEHLSLSAVFGERMPRIPISSNKSMIGHTLSAAGAIEAAFSLLSLRDGILPPTINYDQPDPAIELDVVPNVKREMPISAVLSNSFGFGGQNACLVLTGEPG